MGNKNTLSLDLFDLKKDNFLPFNFLFSTIFKIFFLMIINRKNFKIGGEL